MGLHRLAASGTVFVSVEGLATISSFFCSQQRFLLGLLGVLNAAKGHLVPISLVRVLTHEISMFMGGWMHYESSYD